MKPLRVSPRTRITRIAERQVTDRGVLYDVLDAGLVAHVGLVRDGLPVVLPLAYARSGDCLLLHGSTGGGLLRAAAQGAHLAVTVTMLDGLVYARSMFDSSMNYRSAMICGTAQVLRDDEKLEALHELSEHLMPGRWSEVRAPTAREVAATLILRLDLDEVSLKVRAEGATTAPDDGESREVWAGVLPLDICAGVPQPSTDTPAHMPAPDSVRSRMSLGIAQPPQTPT